MTKIPGQSSRSGPRGLSSSSGGSGRGVQNTPMSERQQMALLMQMTSGECQPLPLSPAPDNKPPLTDTTSSSAAGSAPGASSGFPATSSSAGGGAGASSSGVMSSGATSGPVRYRDKNGRGESSLHVAAIKGDFEMVKKLLDQGIHPNVTDNAGRGGGGKKKREESHC